jgi:hypothetical protein
MAQVKITGEESGEPPLVAPLFVAPLFVAPLFVAPLWDESGFPLEVPAVSGRISGRVSGRVSGIPALLAFETMTTVPLRDEAAF